MPRDERFTVSEAEDGHRLDQLLAARDSIGSRGKARKAIASGKVRLDGEDVGPSDGGRSCAAGTVVEVSWTRPGTGKGRATARRKLDLAGVEIVYEDDVLLALDKPVGMLTDAATRAQRRDEQTLTMRARSLVGRGDVWPVHRIDRNTSGVVLFAKGLEAKNALKSQWEGEKPRRVYIAFLQGELAVDAADWAHPMRWNRRSRRQEPCREGQEGAVVGRCHVEVTERLPGATVVQVVLDTGRRNQIRLSACLEGHPLVGERQYTPEKVGVRVPQLPKLPTLERQALHATELVVKHPTSGAPLALRSPLPRDLARWRGRVRQSGQ